MSTPFQGSWPQRPHESCNVETAKKLTDEEELQIGRRRTDAREALRRVFVPQLTRLATQLITEHFSSEQLVESMTVGVIDAFIWNACDDRLPASTPKASIARRVRWAAIDQAKKRSGGQSVSETLRGWIKTTFHDDFFSALDLGREDFNTISDALSHQAPDARRIRECCESWVKSCVNTSFGRHYYLKDDLEQEGRIALGRAFKQFNPSLGNKFCTLAWKAMSRQIQDFIKKYEGTAGDAPMGRRFVKAKEALKRANGKVPSDDEVFDRLGLSEKKRVAARKRRRILKFFRLDVSDCGHDALALTSDEPSALDLAERAEIAKLAMDAVGCLPPNEQVALVQGYIHGLPWYDIGLMLGVSEKKAEYLGRKAKKRIKKLMGFNHGST